MRRLFVTLAIALLLAGCGSKKHWHATDISGSMPELSFHMQKAPEGTAVTEDDYRGKIVLLYFGYTHCPDVCPTTLADLADVIKRMDSGQEKVRVLFVSVDPNRDTLKVLGPYARSFGTQFDGLRGTDNEIADLARRYRVAYSVKTKPEYTVMHTSSVYVFDTGGKARLVLTDTRDTAGLADDITRIANGE